MQNIYLQYFKMRKVSYSFVSIIIVMFIVVVNSIEYKEWEKDRIIIHDVISYYSYLPAVFIYHDLSFNFTKKIDDKIVKKKIWTQEAPNGNKVVKMTMGNAICWAPFFLITHGIVSYTGYWINNGYTVPYSFTISMTALIYLFLGLIFLRKLLLRYFSEIATSVTLFGVILGTNLFYYVVNEPGMSHVYSFTFITIFLYLILKWFDNLTIWKAALLGLNFGLIVLIRVTNGVVIILPVLLYYVRINDLPEKIAYIRKNFLPIITFGLISLITISLQLVYWKTITGSWIYNSYQPETFYFNKPHIIEGLFSYRKGWLVYTPIMIFGILGLLVISKFINDLVYPIVIFLIINIYVVFSWWCWWYGGSFGLRTLIDIYGIMALPFAAFFEYLLSKKKWLTFFVYGILIFFIYLNQFQIREYKSSLLHYDSMSKELYWKIFLRNKWPKNYDKLKKPPDYDAAMKGMNENN